MHRTLLIVGFPRSGTTLLRELLGGHPRICAYPNEPRFLLEILKPEEATETVLESVCAAHALSADTRFNSDAQTTTVESWFCVWKEARCVPQTDILLLKLPGLAHHLDKVTTWFQDLHVLHIIRDPRGAVASHRARWPDGRLLPRICEWKETVRAARLWGRAHAEQYHEVGFEALLTSPEATLRRLLAALGLAYTPSLLRLRYTLLQWDGTSHRGKPRQFEGIDPAKSTQWQQELAPAEANLIGYLCCAEVSELRKQMRDAGAPIFPAPHYLSLRARLLLRKEQLLDCASRLSLS